MAVPSLLLSQEPPAWAASPASLLLGLRSECPQIWVLVRGLLLASRRSSPHCALTGGQRTLVCFLGRPERLPT